MIFNTDYIIKELSISEDVLNIYPYGSRIYGTANESSDYDFVIVINGSMLKSGAFKQNAISSEDCRIQGILYSRGGFIDAINNYEITALECLAIDPSIVIKATWPFKIQKWNKKDMIKKIIEKASASWHIANMQAKHGQKDAAKKGIYHSLRILMFGLQLKEFGTITDFTVGNKIKFAFDEINDEMFDTRNYIDMRDQLMTNLRNNI